MPPQSISFFIRFCTSLSITHVVIRCRSLSLFHTHTIIHSQAQSQHQKAPLKCILSRAFSLSPSNLDTLFYRSILHPAIDYERCYALPFVGKTIQMIHKVDKAKKMMSLFVNLIKPNSSQSTSGHPRG